MGKYKYKVLKGYQSDGAQTIFEKKKATHRHAKKKSHNELF